ncbi:MAG: hypothetical protein PHO89_07175 [Methylacidiphilaceae bacterium]|nr:hypothetical protein [Candidatus Methylacidiphilaceae bacterium]
MPEEAKNPEEKRANPMQDPAQPVPVPLDVRTIQPGMPADQRGQQESDWASLAKKLDEIQKDLGNLRKEIRDLRVENQGFADLRRQEVQAERPQEPPDSKPPKEWDEYAISSPGPYAKGKTHFSSSHPPAREHQSEEGPERTTPMQARDALRHLREESRQIGGEAPHEEKQLEKEFGQLQHHRKGFFEQTTRVVRDVAKLQQDQRLHPERVAKDEEKLHHDWQILRKDKETIRHDSQSLQHDAARFGKEHPELRKEGDVLAKEAHREGRDLPPVHADPSSRHGFHPPSHAQKAMEALREKAKEAHSPTCLIVTQAGRHVHIFESTRKELLALHTRYGEDLVRAQKDQALHPEEWKRLRDDRKRLTHDQAAIHKHEEILGRESHAIGAFAQEIGKEDPSLRKDARNLNNQIQAESRDAHRFVPYVPPRHPRGGDRDR